MTKIKTQDDLISEIAKRARFTKSDVKIIFNVLIELMEELVAETINSSFEKTKLLMKVRNFGSLYIQKIPPRKGRTGLDLPETTRVVFRLSENIRFGNRNIQNQGDETLDSIDDM